MIMMGSESMSDITIIRATSNKEYQNYIKNQTSYQKNTSYVALNQNNELIATCDFLIINQSEAIIDNIQYMNANKYLIDSFVGEFSYWNPFIKRIKYQAEVFEIDKNVKLIKIPILKIRVEQLTVNQAKLDNVSKWVKKPEDVIINVVEINDQFVCIDGYSRLMAAYLKGFDYIYYFNEIDDYDPNDYKEFLKWCEDENIFTIKDLINRIVPPDEHQLIWIDRCQNYFKQKNK